jgi:hypothetical protein
MEFIYTVAFAARGKFTMPHFGATDTQI